MPLASTGKLAVPPAEHLFTIAVVVYASAMSVAVATPSAPKYIIVLDLDMIDKAHGGGPFFHINNLVVSDIIPIFADK